MLKDVGPKKPLNYEAVLENPKPVGDVHSKGHFGPWQNDNPRDTPLDGSYEFTNADLSSIHGIGGILASTGRFGGTLGEIAVDGVADVPEFRLDVSDHALPLHAEFNAVVDGTTGDTRLDAVKARVGRSELTATGAVTRSTTVPGHDTDLHVVMERGRIEDMLALSMKAKPTLMRGALATKTHIEIPPGPVSVSRKMRLEGTFAIHDAFLNDAKMQQQLDSMSERAKGKPKLANAKDAEVVGSSLSGRFSQADAVMDVNDLVFTMPGAQVSMNGQVQLVGSTFEFHGKVRTEATASQMTTGWKSLLLKPFDKLLKKNGAGMELPIKVTGTGSTYDLRLDFPHDTRGPTWADSIVGRKSHSIEPADFPLACRDGETMKRPLLVSVLSRLGRLAKSLTEFECRDSHNFILHQSRYRSRRRRPACERSREDGTGMAAAAVSVCAGSVLRVPGRAGDGAAVVDADMGPE